MVQRLWQKIRRPAPDGLQCALQGILRGHNHHVHARIAPQRSVQKIKRVGIFEMCAGKDQPAAARANQAQGLFGDRGRGRFVTHVSNQMRERVPLGWVVVEDTGRECTLYGGYHYRFVSCVSHVPQEATAVPKRCPFGRLAESHGNRGRASVDSSLSGTLSAVWKRCPWNFRGKRLEKARKKKQRNAGNHCQNGPLSRSGWEAFLNSPCNLDDCAVAVPHSTGTGGFLPGCSTQIPLHTESVGVIQRRRLNWPYKND